MELDPKYVDVVIQRYIDYTGNTKIRRNGIEEEWSTTPQAKTKKRALKKYGKKEDHKEAIISR